MSERNSPIRASVDYAKLCALHTLKATEMGCMGLDVLQTVALLDPRLAGASNSMGTEGVIVFVLAFQARSPNTASPNRKRHFLK